MSRIKSVIQNTKYNFILMIASIVIGFISRKIFLENLGAEFVGLISSALSIILFISFTEMGLQQAILTSLYKPFHEKNEKKIESLVVFMKVAYKYVAIAVITMATIVAIIFSDQINASGITNSTVIIVFYSLLVSTLVDFLFNYKQVLFIADQKQYKVFRLTQSVTILTIIIQCLLVLNYKSYFCWVIPQIVSPFIKAFLVTKKTRQEYGFINFSSEKSIITLAKEARGEIKKIKKLSIHRLSGLVTENADNIYYLYFAGVSGVAAVGNYKILFSQVLVLLNTINNSIAPSVGNVIASGVKYKIEQVFWTLYAIRSIIASIVVVCFFCITQPFVNWWLGADFIMPVDFLILLIINTSLIIHRITINEYILGYSIFDDIKSPMLEIVLNVLLSLSLGSMLGINGVLLGIVITNFLIGFCWKPYYLCKCGIGIPFDAFIIKVVVIIIPHCLVYWCCLYYIPINQDVDIMSGFLNAIIYSTAMLICNLIIILFLVPELRSFMLEKIKDKR